MASPYSPHYSLDPNLRWEATRPGVERAFRRPSSGGLMPMLLSHPALPFVDEAATGPGLPSRLRATARQYLERVAEGLPELKVYVDALGSQQPQGWDWLTMRWGSDDPHDLDSSSPDPRLSFWIATHFGPSQAGSRSAVLLACPREPVDNGPLLAAGGNRGLRVLMQVDPPLNGMHRVRITESSFGGRPGAPAIVAAVPNLSIRASSPAPVEGPVLVPSARLALLRSMIADRLGFDANRVVLTSFAARRALDTEGGQYLQLDGMASHGDIVLDTRRVEAFGFTVRPGPSDASGDRIELDYQVRLVTHANQLVTAFERDGASQGTARTRYQRAVTCDEQVVDQYRADVTSRLPTTQPLPSQHRVLSDDTRVAVIGGPLSKTTMPPGTPASPQTVPDGKLALRSDDLAAEHAYLRGQELMQRLTDSGLVPELYFREARLPLLLRYHAAMKGGDPNGHSVNAQVEPTSEGLGFYETYDPNDDRRSQLEVRFAAANLAHLDQQPSHLGRRRPQAMGLAADERWAWHEFGHVLAFAATGELELIFAHSAGDALAAILGDPDSKLPFGTGGGPFEPDHPARFLTFPWVPIKRRHDREARLGWCWCGARHLRRRSGLARVPRVFTGYFAEQLLSTTLFRLYRALGGDTARLVQTTAAGELVTADPPAEVALRRAAADYTAYLMMRALLSLGAARIVPATTADHLQAAMASADVATGTWTMGGSTSGARSRIGGTAHKVVRWAFEQQGLFATTDPDQAVEKVGRPPAIDLHIPGRGARALGDYAPVALTWGIDMPWHADYGAIWQQGVEVHVKVRNRGTLTAAGVVVRAWWRTSASGAWQQLPEQTDGPIGGSGGEATFRLPAPTDSELGDAQGYWVLAYASHADDRCNLDPASGLSCAASAPPIDIDNLIDLVAGDNNIGLRWIER